MIKFLTVLVAVSAFVCAQNSQAPTPEPSPVPLPKCTSMQYNALRIDAEVSPFFNDCAVDLNVTTDALKGADVLTQVNKEALRDSTYCMLLFGDVASNAARQECAELQLLANVTWDMAIAGLNIYTTPKVTQKFSKLGLSWAFSGLAFHSYFYKCLGVAGWGVFKDNGIPTVEKVKSMRSSSDCETLFGNVQETIKKQPHYAIDKRGTDIHAFETIPFTVAMDWLVLIASFKHEPIVNLSVDFHHTTSTISIMVFFMISAIALAVAVLAIALKRAPRHAVGERTRLLE